MVGGGGKHENQTTNITQDIDYNVFILIMNTRESANLVYELSH